MSDPIVTPPSPPATQAPTNTGDPPSLITQPNPTPTDPPAQTPEEIEAARVAAEAAAAPAEFVPLTPADISFPEGVQVDETLRDEFLTVINNRELSVKDQTQALIDLQLKAASAASEASSQAWTEMQTKWQDEVRADPEVGGANLTPTLGRIGRLLDEHGSPELKQVFDITGAGNNPHMVKFLNNMAKQLTEGGPASGQPAAASESVASRLFPSMKG